MRADRARLEARLRLTRLAIGGWAAQSLFAANELGLFDLLKEIGPATGDQIASKLGTDPDATRRLLGALVASGVLERDGETFANGLGAREFLVSGTPESMTTWMELIGTWNQTFGKLAGSVRSGGPAEVPEEHLGDSDEYTRAFIIGMHDYALGPGHELARHLDLSGRKKLLDVGGGPGTYSILLAEANPELSATVFDLPAVIAIAEDVIAKHGVQDRVGTHGGDYHTDDFPRGYDVVLVSNTLHQEDDESCLRILKQAYESLDSGGICVVQAMPMNEDQDGPLWPALHNLLMLLVYRGGRAYTVGQYSDQLRAAGFKDVTHRTMSVFNAESYIVGKKP